MLVADLANHITGKQVVQQNDAGARVKACGELTETGVEAQGQERENAIAVYVLKVACDARRARHHVPVRQHDALRQPGAAGRVENRNHVAIDTAVRR